MNNEEIRKQFKKGVKYSKIGFLILLLSIIPMALLDGLVKYILAIIILGISLYLQRQYKCPCCGYVFDPRLKSNELLYCPNCSEKLQ